MTIRNRHTRRLYLYLRKAINRLFFKNRHTRMVCRILRKTVDDYGRNNCAIMAAGMSFFGLLSLIPLVIIAVSALGYVIGSSETAHNFMARVLEDNFPASAKEMVEIIYGIIASPERSIINGLSLIGLVWSGMRIFSIVQSVLNSIWVGATPRNFYRQKAFAFLIFLSAGAFFWLSFAIQWLLTAIRKIDYLNRFIVIDISGIWIVIGYLTPFISIVAMTFLVYMFIPHADVNWKGALIGAGFSALFLEIFKRLFELIVLRFSNYGSVYGPLAGIIIFISWLYTSMQIFLLGAELASQCQTLLFEADKHS